MIEISPSGEPERLELFALARSAFGQVPGWSDVRVLDVLAEDAVFVARERGRLAGYVAVRREPGQLVVEQLLVAPGHERRGIGRRLLAYAEGLAIAERRRALRIVVERDNRRARSFYRQVGFRPLGAELVELLLPSPLQD